MAAVGPPFLTDERVVELLDGQWENLTMAMYHALLAAASKNAIQPVRTFTPVKNNGVLLSMPGYVDLGNITHDGEETLACKLVTSFEENSLRKEPLPTILATILLFDHETGKLKCVMEGTEITARRTAAASVAATNILYKNRHLSSSENLTLAIFGAGAQGRSHALAFHATYPNISEIRIWNHHPEKAELLVRELKGMGVNQAIVSKTGKECAENADIIVTATYSNEPILHSEWIKDGAHINAVGAGLYHHSELDVALYRRSKIYLDDDAGARRELEGLVAMGVPLIGPVGVLHFEPEKMPGKQEVTVFHSCGMAAEDALAARLVYNRHMAS